MATTKKKIENKQESKLTEAQRKIRLLNLIDTVLSEGRVNLANEALEEDEDALYELNKEVRKFLEEKIESILSGGTQKQATPTQSGLFTGDETIVLKEFAQKMLVKAGAAPSEPKKPKQSPVMAALTQNKNVIAQIQAMGLDPKEMKPEQIRQLVKELEDDDAKRESESGS